MSASSSLEGARSAAGPIGVRSADRLTELVRQRVDAVLDPCSVHNGTRLTFTQLGMVDEVSVDGGDDGATQTARIRLVIDDPVCVYMVEIITGLREAALSVSGIADARVEIAGEELWTPDRLPEGTVQIMNQWERSRRERRNLSITPVRAATPVGA